MGVIPDLLVDSSRYIGGSNLREDVAPNAPNVYDTGAPLSAHLHYHHEMEYVADSIRTITFMGIKMPSSASGATYISDTVATTKEILGTQLGQKMKDKGVCYVRKLVSDRTNPAQTLHPP